MLDRFNRNINYLRISVTDRCNLRCRYCVPCEDFVMLSHKDILTFDEITQVVKCAADMGIVKVRLTGGEPLVRRDVVELVKMISAVPGIIDLGMTTNGILLERFAARLSEAGLDRINVSLDTIDAGKYSELTAGGDISMVFRGIEAALKEGLDPVKINCVIENSSDEPDALAVKRYGEENGLNVRFIHQMNLGEGEFSIVEGGAGGDCKICNRLRLTSNGLVKPCLFSDVAFNVRNMGAKEALTAALFSKPESGTNCVNNHFYNIGG